MTLAEELQRAGEAWGAAGQSLSACFAAVLVEATNGEEGVDTELEAVGKTLEVVKHELGVLQADVAARVYPVVDAGVRQLEERVGRLEGRLDFLERSFQEFVVGVNSRLSLLERG